MLGQSVLFFYNDNSTLLDSVVSGYITCIVPQRSILSQRTKLLLGQAVLFFHYDNSTLLNAVVSGSITCTVPQRSILVCGMEYKQIVFK